MRVFKTRLMTRFCRSEGITDPQLAKAIAERGLIAADLGGGLIKQRIARQGQGKSGGWRTVIAYRAGDRAVFVYGFAKNQLDNIDPAQLTDLKTAARELLSLSPPELATKLTAQTIVEVLYDEKN